MSVSQPNDEQVSLMLRDALIDRLKGNLREKILERIKPDIEAAVQAAVSDMDVAINKFVRRYEGDVIYKIVLDDKRTPK